MGSTLYSEAHYDNTDANPANPNKPPKNVHLGEKTTDEMMLVYFSYTPYQAGDENIIIDSSLIHTGVAQIYSSIITTPQLYEPSPNPALSNFTFQYFLPKSSTVKISIADIQGKIILEENPVNSMQGLVTSQLNISELPAGIYFLTLNADGVLRTKKLVKE